MCQKQGFKALQIQFLSLPLMNAVIQHNAWIFNSHLIRLKFLGLLFWNSFSVVAIFCFAFVGMNCLRDYNPCLDLIQQSKQEAVQRHCGCDVPPKQCLGA